MFYLFLEGSLAAGLWMGFSITAVTNLSRTFRTFTRFFLRIGTHHHRTFGVGTPLKMWILLYLQIAQKLPIFVISGQIDKRSDEFIGKWELAMRTAEVLDPHASDLHRWKDTSSLR